ncbi:hypothetical protein HDU98_004356, partial [Podochytrium sp. JEL0797]
MQAPPAAPLPARPTPNPVAIRLESITPGSESLAVCSQRRSNQEVLRAHGSKVLATFGLPASDLSEYLKVNQMSSHDLAVSMALMIKHLFKIQKLEAVREAFTSKKALQNARQFYYETLATASCCSVNNFTGKFGGIFGDLDEEPHQV